MAAYVHTTNGGVTGVLTADSLDELHIFAGKIGVCRNHFLNNPPRYFLSQWRVSLAEKFGAAIIHG